MAKRLQDMPNIGEKLAKQLADVGITDPLQLAEAGSRQAWLRIRAQDPSACYMRLCALEGALRGIRWHDLDAQTKAELKAFYSAHQ